MSKKKKKEVFRQRKRHKLEAVPVEYVVDGNALYRLWLTSDRGRVPNQVHPFLHQGGYVFRELLCMHGGGHEACIRRAQGIEDDIDEGAINDARRIPVLTWSERNTIDYE
jgi:Zn-finger domain-containing protein